MRIKSFVWEPLDDKTWFAHKFGGLLVYSIKKTLIGYYAPFINDMKITRGVSTFDIATEICENDFLVRLSHDVEFDGPELIGIERVGRTNKFTFRRGAKTFAIETYGTTADNLNEWKELAGMK